MARDRTDELLAKIDAAVGPPETETDVEHEARRVMIERDHRAREIRRASEER
jgi:hypothetical protein